MNKKVAIILINYKDYAEKYLTDCAASLQSQNYSGEMKIFITDNVCRLCDRFNVAYRLLADVCFFVPPERLHKNKFIFFNVPN